MPGVTKKHMNSASENEISPKMIKLAQKLSNSTENRPNTINE